MRCLVDLVVIVTVLVILTTASHRSPVQAEEWFLRMDMDGQRYEGLPLHWDKEHFRLLQRDGQMREFAMQWVAHTTRVREPFRALTQGEMRNQLAGEFRDGWEITASGNYLIVHPVGESTKWPPRFEQLYRELLVYFVTRGFTVTQPQFALVAIVFPDQQSFLRHAAASGTGVSSQVLGYYDHRTNRIFLYDESAGGRQAADWRHNAETIVHEAAHQTAFNLGLHTRFADTPRWVIEGLGTLFEAPGIYNAGHHPTLNERIHPAQIASFRRSFGEGLPRGTLTELIAYDRLYRTTPNAAYTLGWALTFMLSETQPLNYISYLEITSQKKPFVQDSPHQRLHDFQSVFGADMALLEGRLHRYLMELDGPR